MTNLGLPVPPGLTISTKMFTERGIEVILVRPETTPDDLHGMVAARGVLTQHGGATSHASVVARQLGKPCAAGCEEIKIDIKKRMFAVNGHVVKEGDTISLNGTTGKVFEGEIPMLAASFDEQEDLDTVPQWADEFSRLKVWANADTPEQAKQARGYGAQGIGLCRTEHMFMGERTVKFQEAILADEEGCQNILDEVLLPLQRQVFYGIFQAMDGLPVIVRLLDPPLHEFLFSKEELLVDVTRMAATGDFDNGIRGKKRFYPW